ncbi:MAG: Peptidase [Hyphomicrobiales bacterium]|nr:Peptidase [Hyphomicrobiales bacterium]
MAGSHLTDLDRTRTGFERRMDRGGAYVELGVEPPIESDGGGHSDLDRRRVSVRWLAGTILTGFTGASLIAASVYAALDPNTMRAEAPEIAATDRNSPARESILRKGDRLVKSVDLVAARQTFRTPTTVRAGEREIVRNRTFTRVATTLAMTQTGFADDVPPFNPLKLLAGGPSQVEAQPEPDRSREDADVSFTSRDLGPEDQFDESYGLSLAEIEAQVTEHIRASARSSRSSIPLPPQLLLMRTSRAALDGAGGVGGLSYATANVGDPRFSTNFSSIQVRMVPENVTPIPKAEAQGRKDSEERLVVVRRNETLEDILKEAGAGREQSRRIIEALSLRRGVGEGQRLKVLLFDPDGSGQKMQIARLSVYNDDAIEATVAMADNGEYVQVAKAVANTPAPRRKPSDEEDEDDEESGGVRLYNSFYETALKQDVPKPIIDDLVRIFANDVDFQRSVSGGDSFEVFYEESEEGDGRQELLYASVTARSETFRYYRYQSPDDGVLDFYDPSGRSTRKFLIRKPIAIGEQRSGFGMRFHPIMRYSRMHTGVDWAAPVGTPIVASGNGTVIKAARESGYGNRVEVQHANGYITTYNHMSGFARGITEGVRVRQGQVVGFLGSTGLSTGPHLHYEVIVNGNFVDPLRIRLARTRELSGRQVAEFKRERERIDDLLARAPNAQRFAARQN